MSKNIVDAYKEFNGQLIILISGLSGSGKSELGKDICRDFKIKCLDLRKFYNEKFDVKVKLSNEKIVVNYDNDDAINWSKLSDEVNKMKKDGVLVVGNVFPIEKLEFKTDFHIHLKISKQEIKQKILDYIDKHKEKNFDAETETLRFNTITYPYYLDSLKRMKMTKFMDVTGFTNDKIYDDVFDILIKHIKDNVESYNPHKPSSNPKAIKHDNLKNNTNSDITSMLSDGETVIDDEFYVNYTHDD